MKSKKGTVGAEQKQSIRKWRELDHATLFAFYDGLRVCVSGLTTRDALQQE